MSPDTQITSAQAIALHRLFSRCRLYATPTENGGEFAELFEKWKAMP